MMDKLIDISKCSITLDGIEIKAVTQNIEDVKIELENLKHEQMFRINSDSEITLNHIMAGLSLYFKLIERFRPNNKCDECIFTDKEYDYCILYETDIHKNTGLPCTELLRVR